MEIAGDETENHDGQSPVQERIVDSGTWPPDTTWELVLSEEHPDPALCTAVACVAIFNIDTQEIVLTRNTHSRSPARKNKWEVLAGHIDPLDPSNPQGLRETPTQALAREALEEAGFIIERAVLFGYRRIRNPQSFHYPKISYMPYYWATTDRALVTPIDLGQPDERTFPIDAIRGFVDAGTMEPAELRIIEYGLAAAFKELRGVKDGD